MGLMNVTIGKRFGTSVPGHPSGGRVIIMDRRTGFCASLSADSSNNILSILCLFCSCLIVDWHVNFKSRHCLCGVHSLSRRSSIFSPVEKLKGKDKM